MFETNSCVPQILLSIAAIVSLSLGVFQDFGQPRPEGGPCSVTAVSVGSKIETASNSTRNLCWANYKGTLNGTKLIAFLSDLKAILYSQSPGEVITPGHMCNGVVFRGRRVEQCPVPTGKRLYHETTRGPPPASPQASQDFPASSNVVLQVSTRGGRTASDTTTHDVDRDISGQPIAPSSRAGQQLSTAEICPHDSSNGMSSPQLQPLAVASSPNSFQSHDENAFAGIFLPYREGLPSAVDFTGVPPQNGSRNGATGSDSFLRDHTGNRAEESTAAREGRANGMGVYGRRQLSRACDRSRGLFNSVSQYVANLLRRLK